jgi:hypothetical protein
MQQEFEKDYFILENKKVHKWFNTQRERLRAFQPEISEYLTCEKVLKQCPGCLEHAVKRRYKKEAEAMSFEEMVIIIEEVLDRAVRQPRPLPSNSSQQYPRNNWRNNPSSTKVEPSKTEADVKNLPNTSAHASRSKDTCNFCKQPGHFARKCPKRRQRINEVVMESLDELCLSNHEEADDNCSPKVESGEVSNQLDNYHFVLAMDQDRAYDPTGPIDRDFFEYAIECEPLLEYSIAEIQAVSHQPQTWTNNCQTSHIEDARLMRCKPDKGKAHLIGFQTIYYSCADQ